MTEIIQKENGVGDIARGLGLTDSRKTGLAFEYKFDLPNGSWNAKLIAKSWGKSSNLICYFEETITLDKYKISAFKNRTVGGYRPNDGEIDFGVAGIEGNVYKLVTGKNKKGNPFWLSANEIPSKNV